MTENIKNYLVAQLIRTVFRYRGGTVKLADIPAAVEAAFKQSGQPQVKTEEEVIAMLGESPGISAAPVQQELPLFPLSIEALPVEPTPGPAGNLQATPGGEPVVALPMSAFLKLAQEAQVSLDNQREPSLLDEQDWELLRSATNLEEWELRTDEVLARHEGEFPDDWLEKVILRGFLVVAAAGWQHPA